MKKDHLVVVERLLKSSERCFPIWAYFISYGCCLLLQGKLDVYRLSIEQRLFEIISEVRREGVDNMIDLKKRFGSTKNNGDLKEHLSKVRKYICVSVNELKDNTLAKLAEDGLSYCILPGTLVG